MELQAVVVATLCSKRRQAFLTAAEIECKSADLQIALWNIELKAS